MPKFNGSAPKEQTVFEVRLGVDFNQIHCQCSGYPSELSAMMGSFMSRNTDAQLVVIAAVAGFFRARGIALTDFENIANAGVPIL